MAKVTRAMAAAVGERSRRAYGRPGAEACQVLMALCWYEARGELPPPQEDLAKALGIPRRTLSVRLGELQGLSLVTRSRTARGVEYVLNALLIRAWTRDEAELEPPARVAGGVRQELPEGQVRERQPLPEPTAATAVPRARVNAVVVGADGVEAVDVEGEEGQPLVSWEEAVERVAELFRVQGLKVTLARRADVLVWLKLGMPLEGEKSFAAAAREMGRASQQNHAWRYVEPILTRYWRELSGGNVVRLGEVRE